MSPTYDTRIDLNSLHQAYVVLRQYCEQGFSMAIDHYQPPEKTSLINKTLRILSDYSVSIPPATTPMFDHHHLQVFFLQKRAISRATLYKPPKEPFYYI